jgi:hypothetical protein
MEIKITTDSEINFTRQILIHIIGVVDLHRYGLLTYQDLCDSMHGLYPCNKLNCFKNNHNMRKIFGLVSEIDVVKHNFPHIYPKSLKQILRLVKNELKKLSESEYDENGQLKWYVDCID